MRFQRDLISFMEIHEIGLHITIPSFIFYISPSKSIDFTVFLKIDDALVKTFCILPHFYLFLYPG